METWDKHKEYGELIRPLVKQIYDLCETHKIPLFCVAAPAQTEDGVECYSSQVVVSPEVLPDRFKIFIAVMQEEVFAQRVMEMLELHLLVKAFEAARVEDSRPIDATLQ